jgi:hypothetical protein
MPRVSIWRRDFVAVPFTRNGTAHCQSRRIEGDGERTRDHQPGRHRRGHESAGGKRHGQEVVDHRGPQILAHRPRGRAHGWGGNR